MSRVVFLNSLFGGRTEEVDPFAPPTFPLTVNDRSGSDALWQMSDPPETCSGRIIQGTKEQVWDQTMEQETVGREWGGDNPTSPSGLYRAPTFSGYGWNPDVAGQMSKDTLVMQGLKDGVLPNVPNSIVQKGPKTGEAIYNNLYKDLPQASRPKKVLVEVQCASHALPWEGGPAPGGPHATFKAALIDWIKNGQFRGNSSGAFTVNASGDLV